ncbi:hypothetical protein ACFLU6_14990, partial [Acidobacteriota bacterium]
DVDESQSWINVELCMAGDCDDDTADTDGTIEISLDDYQVPSEIVLHDFRFILLEEINLRLNVLFSNLDAVGRNIVCYYATPGSPQAPAPLGGDRLTFSNVPTNLEGIISYDASGPFCIIIQILGYPCSDTVNLADRGTQNSDEMSGSLTISGDQITMIFDPDMTMPLDENDPGNGDVTLTGHIVAYGTVPCPVPPESIKGLRAIHDGGGVKLSWIEEPNSSNGYRAYSVGDKHQLPSNGSNPDAILECQTASRGEVNCLDDDPPISSPFILYYQVVGVCADGTEGSS